MGRFNLLKDDREAKIVINTKLNPKQFFQKVKEKSETFLANSEEVENSICAILFDDSPSLSAIEKLAPKQDWQQIHNPIEFQSLLMAQTEEKEPGLEMNPRLDMQEQTPYEAMLDNIDELTIQEENEQRWVLWKGQKYCPYKVYLETYSLHKETLAQSLKWKSKKEECTQRVQQEIENSARPLLQIEKNLKNIPLKKIKTEEKKLIEIENKRDLNMGKLRVLVGDSTVKEMHDVLEQAEYYKEHSIELITSYHGSFCHLSKDGVKTIKSLQEVYKELDSLRKRFPFSSPHKPRFDSQSLHETSSFLEQKFSELAKLVFKQENKMNWLQSLFYSLIRWWFGEREAWNGLYEYECSPRRRWQGQWGSFNFKKKEC